MRQRYLFVRRQDGQTHGATRDGDKGRHRAPVAVATVLRALRPARVAVALLLAVLVNSVVAPQAPSGAQAAVAQVGGSLSAWGWNDQGQLGNGSTCHPTSSTYCSSTPMSVSGLNGVTAIAAGAAHNLALARAGTSTGLTSSANPAMLGQTVTFTATVTSAAGTPSGMVTFKDGTTVLGVASLNGSGQATFTTSSLSADTHGITAAYGGDGSFATSTGSLSQQVAYRVCLLYDPTRASNIGSTIGIKLQLCDVNGHNLSSSTIAVQAVSVDGNAALLVASDGANPGNLFRFDPKLATGGGYNYKLVTTQSISTGSHNLNFIVGGDPSITYYAPFKLK